MAETQAVFIRHKMDSTDKILGQLWNERLIALHYGNLDSADPNKYTDKRAKTALSRLRDYCASGAIVGADFRRIRPSSMLVGEIAPDSQVEPRTFRDGGNEFIYKVVELQNARDVSFLDYPLLAAIQPRQAAITGWPSAYTYLRAILDGTPIPREVGSLHPSQLEVLCYEYLRDQQLLKRLILPIGRGLADIDIWGISSTHNEVLAQVTQETNPAALRDKLVRLESYANDSSVLYLFAPGNVRSEAGGAVHFCAIEDVFEEFLRSADGANKAMLDRMLGIRIRGPRSVSRQMPAQ